MVMAPETYNQGWSSGANLAGAINCGNGGSARRAAACRVCSATRYTDAKQQ
jgi:hypothetical protein